MHEVRARAAAQTKMAEPEPEMEAILAAGASGSSAAGIVALQRASEQMCTTVTAECKKLETVMHSVLGGREHASANASAAESEEAQLMRRRELQQNEFDAKCKAALDEIQGERAGLEADKKAFQARTSRDGVQAESREGRIKLDVGGEIFVTSHSTLTACPTSMLAAMFSGRHTLIPSEDGSHFIDRDPQHFRHILNYLRNGTIHVELDTAMTAELAVEAEYYGEPPSIVPCVCARRFGSD
jgi:hypothetical protein